MNNTLILNPPFSIKKHLSLKFSLKAFWILSFIFIVFLLSLYIFQVSEVTKAGFFVSSYEKELNELAQKNKNSEINFSQVNSLANLETLLMSLNYEKVGQVYYIRVPGSTVVAK